VAIKELRLGAGAATSWKKFDLFEREVRVLRALAHPGIPGYIDHFESDPPGLFYLVMELAPGRNLRAAAAAGARFGEAALVDVLRQTLEILAYLHGRHPPVIHRDVKPANLVRADDGRVRLVDFGGVRDVLRDDGSTVIGTFGYMAPEQLHGGASAATDVYGLGATIVALAGGVEPERVPRKGLRMDLRRHLPGLPPELVAVLERMTEPDPDARPQSAADVLALLADPAPVPDAAPGPGAVVAPEPAVASDSAIPRDAISLIQDTSLPRPLRAVARLVFILIGTAGDAVLSVFSAAILPLIFAIARAATPESQRERLADTRAHAQRALTEGRDEFRALRTAASRARTSRKALPPAGKK
jgi:serine/threonine protein kinase